MVLLRRRTSGLVRTLMSEWVLSSLLVLALLFCHGVLGSGSTHEIFFDPYMTGEGYSPSVGHSMDGERAPDEDPGVLYHVATLLFMLTAALWMRLGNASRGSEIPVRYLFRMRHSSAALYPRGLTAPLLQVFRL